MFSRSVVFAAVLVAGVGPSIAAAATYEVIDLGAAGVPYEINNANCVIGYASIAGKNVGRVWQVHSDGSFDVHDLHADLAAVPTLAGLDNSYPKGMNDAGQIVGWATDGPAATDRAFLATANAGGSYDVVDLHATMGTATSPFRRAYDINNAGILTGVLNQSHPLHDPWPKAVVVDAANLPAGWSALSMGGHPHTTAYALSEAGQLVGYCEANPRYYAASWATISAPLREMNPAPADEGPTSSQSAWAYAVNDHGLAVGASRGMSVSAADYTATLWDTSVAGAPTPVDLDPASVFRQSLANDVNNAGQVVGWGDTLPYNSAVHDYHAIVWQAAAGIVDLNTQIPAGSGWSLQNALAVNASGWIVGTGQLAGQSHVFLLRPPEFDQVWQGPPDGDWFAGENWDPPGTPVDCKVNLPGGGVVVSTDSPLFLAAPATAKVSELTVGHPSGDGTLSVKYDPGALGAASLSELLSVGGAWVGKGGNGAISVQALAPWTPPPPGGPLPVAGLKTDAIVVGETNEGNLQLGGPHGAAAVCGSCVVGNKTGSAGTLSLENVSWLKADSVKIAVEPGSAGTMLIGGNSTVKVGADATGDVSVGGDHTLPGGTGSLHVFDGGKLALGGKLTVWPDGKLSFASPDGTQLAGRVEAPSVDIYGKLSGSGTLVTASASMHSGSEIDVAVGKTIAIESGVPVNVAGKVTATGGTIESPSSVKLLAGGKIDGFGQVLGAYKGETGSQLFVQGGQMTVGDATKDNAFDHAGSLSVDVGSKLRIDSKTPALIGGVVGLPGGTIESPSSVKLLAGGKIDGFGQVLGAYKGETGSQLFVQGGQMTVGDATKDNAFDHAGSISVDVGSKLRIDSKTPALIGGATTLSNGTISSAGGVKTQPASSVVGSGGFFGQLWSGGKMSPGFSAGRIECHDGLTLEATSLLDIEIGGHAPGTEYDRIDVSGDLLLGGSLRVQFIDGFENDVAGSDHLAIIAASGQVTGAFSNVAPGMRLATADGLGSFRVDYGPGSPCDPLSVVLSDYEAVPEPSTLTLVGVAAVGLLAHACRRRRAARGRRMAVQTSHAT